MLTKVFVFITILSSHSFASAKTEFGPVPGEYMKQYYLDDCGPGANRPKCRIAPREKILEDLRIYEQFKPARLEQLESITQVYLDLGQDIRALATGSTAFDQLTGKIADSIFEQDKNNALPNDFYARYFSKGHTDELHYGYEYHVEKLLAAIAKPNAYLSELTTPQAWIHDFNTRFFPSIDKLFFQGSKKSIQARLFVDISSAVKIDRDCPSNLKGAFTEVTAYALNDGYLSLFDDLKVIKKIANGTGNGQPLHVRCEKASFKFTSSIKYDKRSNEVTYKHHQDCDFHGCTGDSAASRLNLVRVLRSELK